MPAVMGFLDRFRHGATSSAEESAGPTVVQIDATSLSRMFSAPMWLRDLGLLSWFLIGFALVLVGATWLLGKTSTIVDPVVVGAILATVAAPIVTWLQGHRVPRPAGAAIVLLGLLALGVLILALVLGGIVEQSAQIKTAASEALDKIEGWFNDAGANGTSSSKDDVKQAVPNIGSTLLTGVAQGIQGLTSLVFFLTFSVFGTFFLLKDGPSVRRFVDRNLGVPQPVATTITGNVIQSLRRYFLGVTIVAAFNAVVVGLGAVALGVPLAGTIAVVVFVTAYVPFIGAFVSGAFAVILTLSSQGTTDAVVMLVIVI
ncbi:MAG: AI-2E family transporter, partial [Actinobacteria bacterium]